MKSAILRGDGRGTRGHSLTTAKRFPRFETVYDLTASGSDKAGLEVFG